MTVMEMAEWLSENPRHAKAEKAAHALTKLRGTMSEQGAEIVDRALITYKRERAR